MAKNAASLPCCILLLTLQEDFISRPTLQEIWDHVIKFWPMDVGRSDLNHFLSWP